MPSSASTPGLEQVLNPTTLPDQGLPYSTEYAYSPNGARMRSFSDTQPTSLARRKRKAGELPDPVRKPHIMDCLGWSEEQVNGLRQRDLTEHSAQVAELALVEAQVQAGEAFVVPWDVDLSALKQYGYSDEEIRGFEERMMELAREKLFDEWETHRRSWGRLAREVRAVHGTFNNNFQDYAQRNARGLTEMLV